MDVELNRSVWPVRRTGNNPDPKLCKPRCCGRCIGHNESEMMSSGQNFGPMTSHARPSRLVTLQIYVNLRVTCLKPKSRKAKLGTLHLLHA